ncbi:MAG TPA: hypothetical protein VNO18_26090, partial [Xanthobacteraceae bacterium]|nr:hypothetical protein [Xanthobacteraceae bacterium]
RGQGRARPPIRRGLWMTIEITRQSPSESPSGEPRSTHRKLGADILPAAQQVTAQVLCAVDC